MTGPDIDRLVETALEQPHTFEQNERRIQAVRDLAARARERDTGLWSGSDPRVVTLRRERDEALNDCDRLAREAENEHACYMDAVEVYERERGEREAAEADRDRAREALAEADRQYASLHDRLMNTRADDGRLARRVAELERKLLAEGLTVQEHKIKAEAALGRVAELEDRAERAENVVRDHHRRLAAIGGGPCVCDICALAGDGGGA